MLSSIFYYLAIAAAVTSVSAQDPDISIDPGSVDLADREEWCRAQIRSCPKICGGPASPNTCNSNTLEFECVCANGETPNVSEYEETLPFYICQRWIPECLNQAQQDVEAEQECVNVDCGTKNPNKQVDDGSDDESTATETETDVVTSTDVAQADSDEDSDEDSDADSDVEDEDEEDNAASPMFSFKTIRWLYLPLAVVGFGAFGNEL